MENFGCVYVWTSGYAYYGTREVTPIGHCVGATLLVAEKDGGVFRGCSDP